MLKTVELFNGKKININIVKGQITEIKEHLGRDKNLDEQQVIISQDQTSIITFDQREIIVFIKAKDITLSVGQQVCIAYLENERNNGLISYNQETKQLAVLSEGHWLKLLDKHAVLRPKRYVLWSRLLTLITAFYFVLGVLWMILGVLGGALGNPFYAFCPIFLYEYFFKGITTSYILLLHPMFLWPFMVIWAIFYFIGTRIFLYFWKNKAVDKIREQVLNSFKEEMNC
ncbi:MAG: hypothetical protein RR677_08860 [Acinetobacter sp.]